MSIDKEGDIYMSVLCRWSSRVEHQVWSSPSPDLTFYSYSGVM